MSAADRASHRAHPRAQWRRAVQGTIRLTAALALTGASAHRRRRRPPAPARPVVTAGWNEGFFIQTPNGDNRLQIGFVAQADGRFALDDPLPITNTFVMRKARPTSPGAWRSTSTSRSCRSSAGSVVLLDGYFDIRFSPKLRLRSGKDKTPVGYELLIGDAYLIFPERSVVSLLVPNRDVGFQAQGDLAGGRAALLRPASSTATRPMAPARSRTSTRTTARISPGASSWMPFRSAKTPPHALNNFGFHLGGSTGNQSGRAAVVQDLGRPDLLLVSPATTTADGRRNRVTPGGLPLSQELRRLRRVRPHRRRTS